VQLIDRYRKAAEQEDQRDAKRNVVAIGQMIKDPKIVIDPYLQALEVVNVTMDGLMSAHDMFTIANSRFECANVHRRAVGSSHLPSGSQ